MTLSRVFSSMVPARRDVATVQRGKARLQNISWRLTPLVYLKQSSYSVFHANSSSSYESGCAGNSFRSLSNISLHFVSAEISFLFNNSNFLLFISTYRLFKNSFSRAPIAFSLYIAIAESFSIATCSRSVLSSSGRLLSITLLTDDVK